MAIGHEVDRFDKKLQQRVGTVRTSVESFRVASDMERMMVVIAQKPRGGLGVGRCSGGGKG